MDKARECTRQPTFFSIGVDRQATMQAADVSAYLITPAEIEGKSRISIAI